MSLQQRKSIAHWFMLIVGIAVMTIQVVKYANNTLKFTLGEVIVTVVSVSLMIFPKYILRVFENFANSKKPNI